MMLRSVPSRRHSVFLTFDDGPDPVGTVPVLEVLRKHEAKATFFLIADKVQRYPHLLRAILNDGHAVGNHSPDHAYRHYFQGVEPLKDWIMSGDRELRREGAVPVGFRPPAGVITPKLKVAAAEVNQPLVMWNERFFDAVFPWTESRARRSAARIKGGSIVLLHDRQKLARVNEFCKTLDTYLACLKERDLKFEPLTHDICHAGGATGVS